MTTITVAELNDLWRWCEDIGQFSTDRPINDTKNHEGSCIHRTPFCNTTCYNLKLYNIYPNMHNRDDRCETIWQKLPTDVEWYVNNFKPFFERK